MPKLLKQNISRSGGIGHFSIDVNRIWFPSHSKYLFIYRGIELVWKAHQVIIQIPPTNLCNVIYIHKVLHIFDK